MGICGGVIRCFFCDEGLIGNGSEDAVEEIIGSGVVVVEERKLRGNALRDGRGKCLKVEA